MVNKLKKVITATITSKGILINTLLTEAVIKGFNLILLTSVVISQLVIGANVCTITLMTVHMRHNI